MKNSYKFITALLTIAMLTGMTACSKKAPAVASDLTDSQISDINSQSSSDINSKQNSSTVNASGSSVTNSSTVTANSNNTASSATQATTTATTTKAKSGGTASSKPGNSTTTSSTASKSNSSTSSKSSSSTTMSSAKPSTSTSNVTPTAPKTAYDRPFNATQIRNDMIAYGKSKGLILDESLWVKSDFSTNAGYDPPTNTAQDVGNASQFIQDCKDSIDLTIAGVKVTEPTAKNSDIRFNIVLLPNSASPGDYIIFVLYG